MKKDEDSKSDTESGWPISGWQILIGTCFIYAIAALQIIKEQGGPDLLALLWIIPVALVVMLLFALLFVLRKLIWLILKCVVTRKPVIWIRKTDEGCRWIKCPSCSTSIPIAMEPNGDWGFRCDNCGAEETFRT